MSKKKRPNPQPAAPRGPLPVLHGNAFVTFLKEAQSLLNELTSRREFDNHVVEYLKQKSLVDEFDAWLAEKRNPPQS